MSKNKRAPGLYWVQIETTDGARTTIAEWCYSWRPTMTWLFIGRDEPAGEDDPDEGVVVLRGPLTYEPHYIDSARGEEMSEQLDEFEKATRKKGWP